MDILKYENVNWSLPGLIRNKDVIFLLLNGLSMCNVQVPNISCYGTAMPNAWSKNTLFLNEFPLERYEIVVFEILHRYLSLKITPILKFDDYKIDKKNFSDAFANDLLNFAGTHNSKVIISNDDLLDYVKSKYPNLKCIASEKKSIIENNKKQGLSYYDTVLKKYDEVILNPNFVVDCDLKELKGYDKISKMHVVADNNCIKNCPNLKNFDKCDYDFEKKSLKKGSFQNFANCKKRNKKLTSLIGKTLLLDDKKIRDLIDLGFNNFMLQDKYISNVLFEEKLFSYVFESVGYSQYFRSLPTEKCGCGCGSDKNGKCNQI